MDSWRKFQQLSGVERSLLMQSLLLLPLIALALHFLGFRRLHAALAQLLPNPTSSPQKPSDAATTAQMVLLANRRGFYRANCLQQSLVLWALLRRQGMASDLRIGVRKAEGKFEAHAWVEYRGCVLNDCQEVRQQFTPFAEAILPLGAKTV